MDTGVEIALQDVSSKFTEETLNSIVKQAGGESCERHEFKTGFKKGDSYLSELYRLKLWARTKSGQPLEVNTVIKCIPKNVGRRKTFRSADFFRNECNFYNEIMTSFQKLVASKGCTYDEIPKCYAAFCDGENDFVVVEDLGQYGFGTASRNTGMDYDHCVKCMETLGRFHGLSLALRDQQPEEFERLTGYVEETYYAPRLKDWYQDFSEIQQAVARDAVSKEYPGEVLASLEKFFAGNLYDKMCALTHTRTKYAVINHGDCWAPNFLFKYGDDNAAPLACRIIDFQLARYSSPVLDISFFIYSCTQQALRESHFDKLLAVYHKTATDMIASLGSNPEVVYPMVGLQAELKQFARFGVGMAIEAIPFSLMDDEETADLDSIEGEEMVPITKIWILKNLKDQAGRLRLADTFVHAKKHGYLE